jgi:hypothetical protein
MLGSYRGFGAASEPLDLGNLRSSCPPKTRPVATDQRERMAEWLQTPVGLPDQVMTVMIRNAAR